MNAMAYLRTFQTTTMKLFFPAGIYLFKVKNRNTRIMCETSSKLAIKTPQRRHVNYKETKTDFTHCFGVSIVDFEQINAAWAPTIFTTSSAIVV